MAWAWPWGWAWACQVWLAWSRSLTSQHVEDALSVENNTGYNGYVEIHKPYFMVSLEKGPTSGCMLFCLGGASLYEASITYLCANSTNMYVLANIARQISLIICLCAACLRQTLACGGFYSTGYPTATALIHLNSACKHVLAWLICTTRVPALDEDLGVALAKWHMSSALRFTKRLVGKKH